MLAFVIIGKKEYCRNLLPRFAELKLKYFPDVNTIFHERDIRHFEGNFKFLINAPIHKEFMADLSTLMSEINYKVAAVAVNKDQKVRKGLTTENLYELGVKYGLETLEKFLVDEEDSNYTTISFEARGKKEDAELLSYFKESAKDIFGISIQRKSAEGLGLQFADLVARPIAVHLLRPEQLNRAWDVIKNKLCPEGLTVLPK